MTNVEMVRMSAQDKKLSNPSKTSGKKAADFSQLISEKAADAKDTGTSQPNGKVQEKENCGKTEPEDKTDADADNLQTMQQYQDFAARLEWEISQPVLVYEEPSSGQEIQALDLNPEEVLQSKAAESEGVVRVPAESQLVLEELPETEKTPRTVLETKGEETAAQDVKFSADEPKTPVKPQETQAEQNSNIPQPEASKGKAGETSKEATGEKTGETPGEKMPESFEMPKSGISPQKTEKTPETDRKKTDSGRIEQAGPGSEEETPKQVQLAPSAESGIRTENRILQTARPTETVRTTRQELSTDVGKTIASRMPLKNGEMVIELEPANLGKIIVRATYDAGRATVALMSANVKTLEILSRDAGTIAGMIEEKTGQETVVFVPKQEEYPEESGKERGSNGREPKQQNDRKKQQSESFLQQIRLGLV